MAWKVIQVILERRLEICDQPMDTVRPRCTRVKPGKGAHSGNYLLEIGVRSGGVWKVGATGTLKLSGRWN